MATGKVFASLWVLWLLPVSSGALHYMQTFIMMAQIATIMAQVMIGGIYDHSYVQLQLQLLS